MGLPSGIIKRWFDRYIISHKHSSYKRTRRLNRVVQRLRQERYILSQFDCEYNAKGSMADLVITFDRIHADIVKDHRSVSTRWTSPVSRAAGPLYRASSPSHKIEFIRATYTYTRRGRFLRNVAWLVRQEFESEEQRWICILKFGLLHKQIIWGRSNA